MRDKIDLLVADIDRLDTQNKKQTIVQLVKIIDNLRLKFALRSFDGYSSSYQGFNQKELLLQYIEDKLVGIYPS